MDMVLIALFAVLLAVCAWISIPATVPFTLQTMGLFLAMGLLGGKRSVLAVLVYLLLGMVGIPVFSGFRGGFGVLTGITGGYLIGFLFAALIYWLITAHGKGSIWRMILGMAAGLLIDYAFGTVWFMLFYAKAYGAIGLWAALMMCVIPYIIPDLIKLGLAVTLVKALPKRIKRLQA
ncbi:MAG TPA: biotin transporter BioY [Candidatus Limiplasma sp.]|nr:biotin transporter BioY [Candidatus Limiplasma sp.]